MKQKLPIAIVSPHSSLAIPPELNGRLALTAADIFNEADVYADELYNFREQVLYWLSFPYARALIDVNRPDDKTAVRPGDGIIKQQTSYGVPVYYPDQAPDAAEKAALIARYWQPWHDQLAAIAADPAVKFVIDAHTMAAKGPTTYSDPGRLRPRMMVGNLGDAAGRPRPTVGHISAPANMARFLAVELQQRLVALPSLTAVADRIALNDPFYGGYNILAHAHPQQPWLMIEISRGLYIGEQKADSAPVPLPAARISALRAAIWESIVALAAQF